MKGDMTIDGGGREKFRPPPSIVSALLCQRFQQGGTALPYVAEGGLKIPGVPGIGNISWVSAPVQQAVDALREAGPDHFQLVLMDVQMPVMDGYEATQKIRQLPDKDLAGIPIIAMTANAFTEDKAAALKSGMNGHISKPIDVQLLFETLDRIL